MSSLQNALRDYVTLRRSLGARFRAAEQRLNHFVKFMDQRGATVITYPLALEWAMQPPATRPTWSLRFTDVRGFSRYLCGRDPRTEVLPMRVLAFSSRAKPYLYTETEIARLLEAALALPPAKALRRWTYYCLFGLLAVTGLRIGEALALQRQDVDLAQGILTIRGAKFGNTRLVPLHPTTRNALRRYAEERDARLNPSRSDYFFVAERGGKLLHQYVWPVFIRLSRQIGLRGVSDHSGPRLHDLRHRFAVQTLVSWYRSGEPVEQLLPVLSTYLGHACVRDTYWYLSACPELMGQSVQRLDNRWRAAS
ncbi:MAG TPA: tyrosine-type recombinase/integrase [Lacipirellulaceae bacterium]